MLRGEPGGERRDEAARIRADALDAAQRIVEAARRTAEDLREQAARQADALLRTARAEAQRLSEEANAQRASESVERVSWDAPARILEAANAEVARLRETARAEASAALETARSRAEQEAAQLLDAARRGIDERERQLAADQHAVAEELEKLAQLASSLLDQVAGARARLGKVSGQPVGTLADPATVSARLDREPSGSPSAPIQAGGPVALEVSQATVPAAPAVAPVSGAARAAGPVVAERPRAPAAEVPIPGGEQLDGGRDDVPAGDVDLVLPASADRMTLEVTLAVLREQPGVQVQPPIRRDGNVVVPLRIERALPLVAILLELPRVTGATFVPAPPGSSGRVDVALA